MKTKKTLHNYLKQIQIRINMETKRNQYKNYYAIRYNFEPKKE